MGAFVLTAGTDAACLPLSSVQVKIGIPVALIVIIAAVVGGVVGSRSSKSSDASSSSANGGAGAADDGNTSAPNPSQLASLKTAIGLFATATNSFSQPVYPSVVRDP